MAQVRCWCRVSLVAADGTVLHTHRIAGRGDPDMGAVDAIARLALTARRAGWDIILDGVEQEMRDLLALAGLSVDVKGQAEGGEEPLGIEEIEEEAHGRDPAL